MPPMSDKAAVEEQIRRSPALYASAFVLAFLFGGVFALAVAVMAAVTAFAAT